jgi:uncharacterized membrane protein HdeD (DUF308 family)
MPRWALITFGVLTIILGVLAVTWPELTIVVLVMLLGIQLLVYGGVSILSAFKEGKGRILAVIFGVLSLIAGAALFLRPVQNLDALVIVLSLFWLVGGMVQAIGSIVDRGERWGLELVTGIISVAAGLVMLSWPGPTLFVIALIAGAWMMVVGVVHIVAAFPRSGGAQLAV